MPIPERPGPERIAEFLLRSRPDVFEKWPKARLLNWIVYHGNQQAMLVACLEDEIGGVCIGWRAQLPDIDDAWCKWDPKGDHFYFHQFHATSRHAVRAMIQIFADVVPDWREIHLMAERNGRRVRIPHALLERLHTTSLIKLHRNL